MKIYKVIIFIIALLIVITGCNDKNKHSSNTEQKENVLWSWGNEQSGFNGLPGQVSIEGDLVLVGGDDKFYYALNKKTGKLEWKFDSRTVDPWKAISYEDIFILGAYGGGVFGVDNQGNQLWKFRPDETIVSQPFIYKGKLYVVEPVGIIHILNPKTGETIETISGYANRDHYVLNENFLYSTDWSEHTVTALNLDTGENEWVTETGDTSMPTSIEIRNETIYVISDGEGISQLSAIDKNTGKIIWSEELHGWVGKNPIFTSDSMYYSIDGTIYEVNLNDKKEVWSKETTNDYLWFAYEPNHNLLFLQD